MNRLKRREQQARARGVYVFRKFNLNDLTGATRISGWDVYVESEWILGPRELTLTYRQAVALAYRIAVSKRHRIRMYHAKRRDTK